MKIYVIGTLVAAGFAGGLFNAPAVAQTADTVVLPHPKKHLGAGLVRAI